MFSRIKNFFYVFSILILSIINISNANIETITYKSDNESAKLFVSNISNKIVEIITDKHIENNTKEKLLSSLFDNLVDSKWMAKFVLGANFRELSETQFDNFSSAYRTFILNKYVPKFKLYSNQSVKIVSSETIGNNKFKVLTTIVNEESNQNIKIDYVLKYMDTNQDFKVIDIVAEEISMITTQRDEITSLMTNQGLDKTIQHLLKQSNQ